MFKSPPKSYLICTTPRSGSWMLCSLLVQTGVAGNPLEFFGPSLPEEFLSNRYLTDAENGRDYLEKILENFTSKEGVFGMKLLANQTPVFIRRASEHCGTTFDSLGQALNAEFPSAQYIFLTRKNKVAQAISFYRGLMTGQWRSYEPTKAQPPEVLYDAYAIERCYQDILASDAYWEEYFRIHTISPLRLSYEDLAADFKQETRRALRYLNLPDVSVAPPETVKLAGALSQEWEVRFRDGGLPAPEKHLDLEAFWARY